MASGVPVLILADNTHQRFLLISIGSHEANAILIATQNIFVSRPLTHDLYGDTLTELGAVVDAAEIIDLHDGTFFGRLRLVRADGAEVLVDARPSDAVAIALRRRAPIRIDSDLFEQQAISSEGVEEQTLEQSQEQMLEEFRSFLDDVDADDFRAPGE